MDKAYDHKAVEEGIYKQWEEAGAFQPEVHPDGEPYCIVLPPPNANAPLHFGHAVYVIEDILIRYHRMRGRKALWLPGADHAGFETQYVFEKKLQQMGKSRFDFDRQTLYQMIFRHVQENKIGMESQLRKLGFSLDWSREKFTLDPDIVKLVYQTFKKMYDQGLIYRGNRLVNYCTRCGTSFSDMEVNHKEQNDPLYYLKYGPFVIATVRPETKFGDTALAVNPNDTRYKKYIGKEFEFETLLGKKKMKVIGDEAIDLKFGTGAMKVTPAHDAKDFEIGKRHNLSLVQIIDLNGKLNEKTGKYAGLYVKQARKIVSEDLQKMGLIDHINETYKHTIEVCYKCGTTIEPMLLPQWFIKVEPLVKNAIKVVKEKKITIHPDRFEKIYYQWLENLHDWNISRQTVWGMRIPAWRCKDCSKIKDQKSKLKNAKVSNNETIEQFNNSAWVITEGEKPANCPECGSTDLEQDPDTFDTWFSSSQWPVVTLKTTKPGDFETFYPTSVMETGYDILKAWVSRMAMIGLYITGDIPFKDVVLHGLVNDPYGKKMSKSKGNVVNPLNLVEQYGADSVRFALAYGTALGNDQVLSYPKLEAMRRFSNKLWNIGRFIEMSREKAPSNQRQASSYSSSEAKRSREVSEESSQQVRTIKELLVLAKTNDMDSAIVIKTGALIKEITKDIDSYNFNYAAEKLYEFIWHEFADKYIEDVKNRLNENSSTILYSLLSILLKLLHPFMPFITEEIYQRLYQPEEKDFLMLSVWPL